MKFRVVESQHNALEGILEGVDFSDILDQISENTGIRKDKFNTSLDASSGNPYHCVIFNRSKVYLVLEPV